MSSVPEARDQPDSAPRGGNGIVMLSDELREHFAGDDAFDRIMQLHGEVYRHHKHRRTMRVELGGRPYFVKIHEHSGIGEITKNLVQRRMPILTARPEYEAIRRLEEIGIPTMTVAGFGERGSNPARLQSFIMTDELCDSSSLETLVPQWRDLPEHQESMLRRVAAERMGHIARRMHDSGMNHRDFYLCHFLTNDRDWASWKPADGLQLALIDLHRVQIRDATPMRWRIKDLAGVLHSSLDELPTGRERLRFWRAYRGKDWKQTLRSDQSMMDRITRRAHRQYRAHHGTPPPRAAHPASFA